VLGLLCVVLVLPSVLPPLVRDQVRMGATTASAITVMEAPCRPLPRVTVESATTAVRDGLGSELLRPGFKDAAAATARRSLDHSSDALVAPVSALLVPLATATHASGEATDAGSESSIEGGLGSVVGAPLETVATPSASPLAAAGVALSSSMLLACAVVGVTGAESPSVPGSAISGEPSEWQQRDECTLRAYVDGGLHARVNTARIAVVVRPDGVMTATVAVNSCDLADAQAQANWMGVLMKRVKFIPQDSLQPAGYVTAHTVDIAMREKTSQLAYSLCAQELHRCLRDVIVEYWSTLPEDADVVSASASGDVCHLPCASPESTFPSGGGGVAAADNEAACAVVLLRARVVPEQFSVAVSVVERLRLQLGRRVRLEAVAGNEDLLVSLPQPGFGRVMLDPIPAEPPRTPGYSDYCAAYIGGDDGSVSEIEVDDVFDQAAAEAAAAAPAQRKAKPAKDRPSTGSCTLSAYIKYNGALYAISTAHKIPPPSELGSIAVMLRTAASDGSAAAPAAASAADASSAAPSGAARPAAAAASAVSDASSASPSGAARPAAAAASAVSDASSASPSAAARPAAAAASAVSDASSASPSAAASAAAPPVAAAASVASDASSALPSAAVPPVAAAASAARAPACSDVLLALIELVNPSSTRSSKEAFAGASFEGAMPNYREDSDGEDAEPFVHRDYVADVSISEVDLKGCECPATDVIPLVENSCNLEGSCRQCLPAWSDYRGEVTFYGRPRNNTNPRQLRVVGYAAKKIEVYKPTFKVMELVTYIAVHCGSGDKPMKGDSGGPVFKNGALHSFIRAEACTFVDKTTTVKKSYAMLTPAHFALQQVRKLLFLRFRSGGPPTGAVDFVRPIIH
jgi:hypothetical protein